MDSKLAMSKEVDEYISKQAPETRRALKLAAQRNCVTKPLGKGNHK